MLYFFCLVPILSLVSAALVLFPQAKFGTHKRFASIKHTPTDDRPWTAYTCGPHHITLQDINRAISTDAVYRDSGWGGIGFWESKLGFRTSTDTILISFEVWHEDTDKNPYSALLTLNNVMLQKRGSTDVPARCQVTIPWNWDIGLSHQ